MTKILRRPGGVYTVSVSAVNKGYGRMRSRPVQLVMLPPITPAEGAGTPSAVPLPPPPLSHHRRPVLGTYTYGSTAGIGTAGTPPDVTDYYSTSGIVLVRGEEVGIVILVLAGELCPANEPQTPPVE